jgi:hypothetical protein
MTREQQREVSVVQNEVSSRRAGNLETLAATMHVSADVLQLADVRKELFKDYSPEQRRRMASEGRAMPDGSFPIGDCADARNAQRAIGRAKPGKRAAVQAHIRKRVRALRCNLSASGAPLSPLEEALSRNPSRVIIEYDGEEASVPVVPAPVPTAVSPDPDPPPQVPLAVSIPGPVSPPLDPSPDQAVFDREIAYQINFFYDHGYWSDTQLTGGETLPNMSSVMSLAVLVATKPQDSLSQVTRDRLIRKGLLY